ncbi:hypothetical protein MGYG_00103 [Nannizzia gypsea CBS 118893]|uniref:Uncharacterized protein n=1 Tax=Arthroderma gypseum (strain ATCC MYA-4604 / CBS 118893) TaxID=535722 RepID=E5R2S5_ARTGP|nr:hypothetical protein MGYG_00103 [Nannizzia gypsea CBS 118893]EFQ97059.1 hypothetical protein MGYG_00103 [Nannizzia gypsea CBS 118893]
MAHPTISAVFSGNGNAGLQFGNNSGTLNYNPTNNNTTINNTTNNNTNYNYPEPRPETSPKPSCKIPFNRDKEGFVDRVTIFDEIEEKVKAPGSWVALVGMGGVGKSQLAIEYAYRLRDQLQLPDTWVFWIYASNSARFRESLEEIAEHAKIPGRDDPEPGILKLVYRWLDDEKRKWVIILDNADDLDFLEDTSVKGGKPNKSLTKYIPKTENGSVFITSRSRETASALVDNKHIIKVNPMDEAHAIDLFQKKLPKPDDKLIAELAAELEFLPLAIVQAASYISHKEPRCSVQEYLDDFRKMRADEKLMLLGEKGRDHRRDRDAVNPISDTWKMSFNHIQRTRPSAADLLALMCFFDRQGIPEFALHPSDTEREIGLSPSDSTPGPAARDISFEDDVSTLRDFCFISVRTRHMFDMHRLVQLATQKWLRGNESFERWRKTFICRLFLKFPTSYEKEGWSRCQQLFPHVKSAVSHRPLCKKELGCWAILLCQAARYAGERGNKADAVTLSTTAIDISKEALGEKHPATLLCQTILMYMGSRTEGIEGLPSKEGGAGRSSSEPLTEEESGWLQMVAQKRLELGRDHPLTLSDMARLAAIYSYNGRPKKAVKLQRKVVKLATAARGLEDRKTLSHRNGLAWIYREQDRLVEAAEILVQVVETSKRVNGPENTDTLRYMFELAETYRRQGRLGQAEQVFIEVVDVSKRVNGLEKPDTIDAMGRLAGTYIRQGRLEQAERLCTEVVDLSKRVFEEGDERTQRYIGRLDVVQCLKETDPETRAKLISKLKTP